MHSFVRDESRAEPRHILSRRQIVRDSAGATFKTKVEGGDVIVEFDRDGDPRRPDEVRFSYGPATRTPKRYRVNGVRDGLHALKHATWLAAVAVFRGAERRITTEWDGRLVFPGDHVLSDLWFFKGKQTFGVASASGNVLALDVAANVPAEWGYGSIRQRDGREWGILRMRGVGPRGLELHPDDVSALAAQTGRSLANVLARDSQDPTTVVIGELTELQETYVARSAIPSDADRVQIEMVADDTRVWQLLDEQVIAPVPVNADNLAEPLIPQISVLHARCQRIETGIEVVWGVSTTRGARNYEADLSYDSGATWEVLSPYGPASSGRAQLRQSDQPVTVRARAFGRTGLPGDYVSTTFTTVAPLIDNSQVELRLPPIDYEGLTEDVRNRIAYILEVERVANEKASDLLARVLAAAAVGDANVAAIVYEKQERLTADTAIAGDLSAAVVRLGNAEAAVVTEREARIDADGAQARRTDLLIAQTDSDRAYFLSEQQVRISSDAATATSLDVLSARYGENLAAITSEQTARADGDSAQAQRTDALIAQTNSDRAYFLNEQTVRIANDSAFASQITAVQARTDAGTATGRMTLSARSDISGVSARFEMLLAAEVGGQTRGTGMTFDLLPGGGSLVRFDADKFVITSPGVSGVPAFSFDAGSGTLSVPYLRLTSGQASIPLRVDIPNYVLIAGAGTVNDYYDANLNFVYTVTNPDFPAFIEVFGKVTITGPQNTQLYGMQLMVDGVLAGYFRFNDFAQTISSGAGNNTFDFRCSCIRYLPAGQRSVRIRFSYNSPGAGQVVINELHLAGFQPKA
ncbi:host specificity factor TipJ family phage tail protein [Methylorubrum extorquens]